MKIPENRFKCISIESTIFPIRKIAFDCSRQIEQKFALPTMRETGDLQRTKKKTRNAMIHSKSLCFSYILRQFKFDSSHADGHGHTHTNIPRVRANTKDKHQKLTLPLANF